MAAVSSNPITQVSQTLPQPNLQPQLLTRLQLDLRGARFNVDRETIMNLPESVLLCLFPNGLVLSRQSVALSDGGDEEDDEIYGVDVRASFISSNGQGAILRIFNSFFTQFDPECFGFVLSFFRTAADNFYGTATHPGLLSLQQHLLVDTLPSPTSSDFQSPSQNPLLTKQAIIVLREELEYFAIPPHGGVERTDEHGVANEAMLDLKRACGQNLLEKRTIFTALQRNVNKENNVAEQHLIDMLCQRWVFFSSSLQLLRWTFVGPFLVLDDSCSHCTMLSSGFDRDDVWGYRAIEPSRCCISSIALVLLKTGITHSPNAANKDDRVTVDYAQMSTAQKLLLFWRKPAVRLSAMIVLPCVDMAILEKMLVGRC